jgi:multidrug resistance efflux pump
MAEQRPIPIPIRQRLRRMRDRLLPVVTFAVCVLLTIWLWGEHTRLPNTVGQIDAVRVDVACAMDGMLVPLPGGHRWELFDAVGENMLVARLDDSPTMAALETLNQEVKRLRASLVATAAQVDQENAERQESHLGEVERLAWRVEQLRLESLDRQASLATDRVQLQRRQEHLAMVSKLPAGVMTERELLEVRLMRDTVAKQIEGNEQALRQIGEQMADAQRRLQEFPAMPDTDSTRVLEEIHGAIGVQNARIDELKLQVDALEVRSPITGRIVAIHRMPGQAVRLGDPIVTIAADRGRHIVSYIRQDQMIDPTPGMSVEVQGRKPASPLLEAVVTRVGPQYEAVPLEQLRRADVPEWGLPVRVAMPREAEFMPGELVDLRFMPQRVGGS